MKTLSQTDKTSRRAFDLRVVRKMSDEHYQFTAHRTAQDAASGQRPIVEEEHARFAEHYRGVYNIRTLVGAGEYSSQTIIRVDAAHRDYPFVEPVGWVVEEGASRLPYSPHFAHGVPICNGTIWRPDGSVLMGHYLIHLARLLNWDEQLPRGYKGYNGEAVQWWRKHINRPLEPDLTYPALPVEDLYGEVTVGSVGGGGFRALTPGPPHIVSGGFRKIG